jgi:hypothetical protein
MPDAVAHVETDRASRHLVQLCTHVSKMGQHLPRLRSHGGSGHVTPEVQNVEWSDTDGTISFGLGRCTLHASPNELILRVEAPDEESLRRLQDLVGHRLEAIGSRDHLLVQWQRLAGPDTGSAETT